MKSVYHSFKNLIIRSLTNAGLSQCGRCPVNNRREPRTPDNDNSWSLFNFIWLLQTYSLSVNLSRKSDLKLF